MAGGHSPTASSLARLVWDEFLLVEKQEGGVVVKRDRLLVFDNLDKILRDLWRILGELPPLTRAVTGGGIVRAIGVNSQTILLKSGLELGAELSGLGLKMGIRVGPHIGLSFISVEDEVKIVEVEVNWIGGSGV